MTCKLTLNRCTNSPHVDINVPEKHPLVNTLKLSAWGLIKVNLSSSVCGWLAYLLQENCCLLQNKQAVSLNRCSDFAVHLLLNPNRLLLTVKSFSGFIFVNTLHARHAAMKMSKSRKYSDGNRANTDLRIELKPNSESDGATERRRTLCCPAVCGWNEQVGSQ